MEISFVPGDYDALMGELSKVTSGTFTFDLPGHNDAAAAAESDAKGKSKKGGKKSKK